MAPEAADSSSPSCPKRLCWHHTGFTLCVAQTALLGTNSPWGAREVRGSTWGAKRAGGLCVPGGEEPPLVLEFRQEPLEPEPICSSPKYSPSCSNQLPSTRIPFSLVLSLCPPGQPLGGLPGHPVPDHQNGPSPRAGPSWLPRQLLSRGHSAHPPSHTERAALPVTPAGGLLNTSVTLLSTAPV